MEIGQEVELTASPCSAVLPFLPYFLSLEKGGSAHGLGFMTHNGGNSHVENHCWKSLNLLTREVTEPGCSFRGEGDISTNC